MSERDPAAGGRGIDPRVGGSESRSGRRRGAAISGVVLAAGTSSRLGAAVPKQLLELDGEPLVRRICRRALASALTEVVLVVGYEAPRVRRAVRGLELNLAENRDFERGQAGSVRGGLEAIDPGADGALFIPVDQPLLDTATLDLLVGAFDPGQPRIVVPVHRRRRGAPVLFPRPFFDELRAIDGDEGGRQLLRRHADDVVEIELASGEPLADIDTPADLERLVGGG